MFNKLKQEVNRASEATMSELGRILEEIKQTDSGQKVCRLDSFGKLDIPLPPGLVKTGDLMHSDKLKMALETQSFVPVLALMSKQAFHTFTNKIQNVLGDIEVASTSLDKIDYTSKLPPRLLFIAPVKGKVNICCNMKLYGIYVYTPLIRQIWYAQVLRAWLPK